MTGLAGAPATGRPLERVDGPPKVRGRAPYAYEQPLADPAYLFPVGATVARGRIASLDTAAAEAVGGVLAVLTHRNAPRLTGDPDREFWVLQSDEVDYRGQFVAAVVAETPETARYAAGLVRITYDERPHDVVLRADDPDLYAPASINGGFPTDTGEGDVEAALASAAVTLDRTYTTPTQHHCAMEPHTSTAVWDPDTGVLTLHDSTQGVCATQTTLAPALGLDSGHLRVLSRYVGGGFGSKLRVKQHTALVALAARMFPCRGVKCPLTRQQVFDVTGYRTPTIQRVRLGADADGRLTAVAHDVVAQTARIKEFAEQAAVPTRVMYAAPNRRTTHRLAALDVAVPTAMRAPGETPGMFAGEVAMDEMAIACGLDPVEFRVRNEPDTEPDSGRPFSSRNLLACLREGARRFGWAGRDPTPGVRRDGAWLVGTGVAASTYPRFYAPGSRAEIHFGPDRCYHVRIGAADIGTGTGIALAQIAADALGCGVQDVELEIADSWLPPAILEGGSMGLMSWGEAVVAAAAAFRAEHGRDPAPGATAGGEGPANPDEERYAMHAFGAHFVEARVDADTGEVRVPRMLGVFAAGRIVNPRIARSQFVGGMVMGISMALHENGVTDPRFGGTVTRDLAEYHVPTHADVGDVDATWIDEVDPHVSSLGAKGIGEIGIVGAAAAVVNAVHHATGVRVRDLPVTPDKLLA